MSPFGSLQSAVPDSKPGLRSNWPEQPDAATRSAAGTSRMLPAWCGRAIVTFRLRGLWMMPPSCSTCVSATTTLLNEAELIYEAIEDGTVAGFRFAKRVPYLPCETECISVEKKRSTVALGAVASTIVRFE